MAVAWRAATFRRAHMRRRWLGAVPSRCAYRALDRNGCASREHRRWALPQPPGPRIHTVAARGCAMDFLFWHHTGTTNLTDGSVGALQPKLDSRGYSSGAILLRKGSRTCPMERLE